MSRIMTIWLPRWPVQRRFVERPERRQAPLIVCRTEPRGVQRVVGWSWAAARVKPRQIPTGKTLAETLAAFTLAFGAEVGQMAEVDQDDPQADRLVLEGIARWCRRFSPTTALEDAEHPECIHVDLAGTAELLGREQTVVRTAVWTLASRGLYARAAVADTPAAAWAAAHHPTALCPPLSASRRYSASRKYSGRRWAVVPPGMQTQWLAELPVAAMRVPAEAIAVLAELGVLTIGQLLQLPRKSVASRLGPLTARRIAEFEGRRAEPLLAVADDTFPQSECHLSSPASTREAVACVLEPLVEQCLAALASRGFGVTVLQVRLSEAVSVSARPTPSVVDIGLFRPSVSARHVVDLVQLRLARMRLPREVESIAVEVVSAGALAARQRVLFDGVALSSSLKAGEQAVQLGGLLDRLAGRLGRMAVFEPRPVVDAQPEHAWVASPPEPGRQASATAAAVVAARLRPLWMTPRPIRVETASVVPDGPPLWFCISGVRHRVADAWGPERIETAWWRGCSIRRDYYVVETESGERWWLFRHLGESRGRVGSALRGPRRLAGRSQRSGHSVHADRLPQASRAAREGSDGSRDRGAWFVHGQFA